MVVKRWTHSGELHFDVIGVFLTRELAKNAIAVDTEEVRNMRFSVIWEHRLVGYEIEEQVLS